MGTTGIYLTSVVLLLAGGQLIFRVLAGRDYRESGRLTLICSLLELALWLGYAAVPYLYNPSCWPFVWGCPSSVPHLVSVAAYLIISGGTLLGLGSMAWLGVRRSFGRQVAELVRTGPYSLSRNPQVLGGLILTVGIALMWPSWYALGWVLLWIGMFHPMVVTEQEHLRKVHGEEYDRYCKEVPQYLGLPTRR